MKTIILNNVCNPYFETCVENTKSLFNKKYGNLAKLTIVTRNCNGSYVKSLIAVFESYKESKKFLKNEKTYKGGFLKKSK